MISKFVNRVLACLVLIGVFTLVAARAQTARTIVKPATEADLVGAYNAFGFDLFSTLTKARPTRNVFISPVSAAFVLEAARSGAGGRTKTEIEKVLRVNEIADLGEMNSALLGALTRTNQPYCLEIANGMWIRKQAVIKPEFIALNRKYLQTEIAAADFADSRFPGTVNAWANVKTHGKIPEIIQSVSPDSQMLVLNATYFKGEWLDPFATNLTKPEKFTLLSGAEIKHPRMLRSAEHFSYFENAEFQAVSLPYGKIDSAEAARMIVFLPAKQVGLKSFVSHLTEKRLRLWLAGFRPREGTLGLPKFKLSCDYDMKAPLASMGMKAAFSPEIANFDGISKRGLFVSQIAQKTYVDVNEKGTEAAAVTIMNVESVGIAPSRARPFTMIVDRPFCVAILHQNGSVLFLGAIVDPR